MNNFPSITQLAGRYLPFVPAMPNGSVDAAIAACPGDVVVVALLVYGPQLVQDKLPHKWRQTTRHVEQAGRVGGALYLTNIGDAAVALLINKVLSGSRTIHPLLFLFLWWLPTRYQLFMGVKERFKEIDSSESQRSLLRRLAATAVVLVLTSGWAEAIPQAPISMAMRIILPGLAALLY